MTAMNLLEYDELVKGMSDAQLIQAAQNPPPGFPQFMAVQQLQENRKTREKYAAQQNKPSDATVADQIVGEAMQGGIMGAMPPQMAMAPQMPQRMPQMPQGIEQAMPPQMMSAGGVTRGKNVIIQEILARNPNPTMADFLAAGLSQKDIENYSYLINPSALDRARSKTPFGRPASEMYEGAGLDADMQMFDPAKIPPGEGSSNVYSGAEGFMGLGSIPKAIGNMFTPEQPAPVDTAAFDLADAQLNRMDQDDYLRSLITDDERKINQIDIAQQRGQDRILLTPEEIEMTNKDFADIARMQRPLKDRLGPLKDGIVDFADDKLDALRLGASTAYDLAGSGIDSLINSRYGQTLAGAMTIVPDSISALFSGPDPEANINQTVDGLISDRASLSRFMDDEFADIDFFDQGIYGGEFKGDLGEGGLADIVKQTTANDASSGAKTTDGSAERVDAGNLPLLRGADAASGRLAELQAMIDKQSAAGTDAARGAALVALGTGIMEGKTAQGGKEAANILAKDAQAQGAMKLQGAKMRLQDARQAERLEIMRDDLLARVGISQNQNNRTALIEVNKAIDALEDDPMLNLQIQTAIKKGEEPDSPKYRRLMQLRQASVFLTQLVAPETKQFFGQREGPDPLELNVGG